MPEAI